MDCSTSNDEKTASLFLRHPLHTLNLITAGVLSVVPDTLNSGLEYTFDHSKNGTAVRNHPAVVFKIGMMLQFHPSLINPTKSRHHTQIFSSNPSASDRAQAQAGRHAVVPSVSTTLCYLRSSEDVTKRGIDHGGMIIPVKHWRKQMLVGKL